MTNAAHPAIRRSPIYLGLLLVVLVMMIAGIAWRITSFAGGTDDAWHVAPVPVRLPPLTDRHGGSTNLVAGRLGLVVHRAEPWCGHCMRELPAFASAAAAWRTAGVEVAVVSAQGVEDAIRRIDPAVPVFRLGSEPDGPMASEGGPGHLADQPRWPSGRTDGRGEDLGR